MPSKEQIIARSNNLPDSTLQYYLNQGQVTLEELRTTLRPDRFQALSKNFKSEETIMWERVTASNSLTEYRNYLEKYPDGEHASECIDLIAECENSMRQPAAANSGASNTNNDSDDTVIMDPDWYQARRQNTVEGYMRYKQRHPNMHVAEVDAALEALRDDDDWNLTIQRNTIDAYNAYLERHPNGTHTAQAHSYIFQTEQSSTILNDLSIDPNSHPATEIQEMMTNNQLPFDAVAQVLSPIKAQAIASFYPPAPLIDPSKVVTFPEQLQQGSTEVYFWGTPSSGKTCALGALLSAAENRFSLDKLECESYDYMTKLANVFKINNGLCNLPPGTASDRIEEMVFRILDRKGKRHRMTLIDIAGEIFRSIYLSRNNMFLNDQNAKTLGQLMRYLEDNGNNKIHFFVVEYGAHDRVWEGLSMKNYLESCATYLQSGNIIRKNTNGVYIIVTKSDKMGCPPEEMPRRALDYVQTHLESFYNNMKEVCQNAGIGDFKVISFTIGDVFAKQLCVYNDFCTDKVLEVLLRKTPVEKDAWWQKVLNW